MPRLPSSDWWIVGLGNPGPEYAHTRHNVGFDVVAHLAAEAGQGAIRPLGPSLEGCRVSLAGQRALLLRPLTYMNRSGDALRPHAEAGALAVERLLVIHDEVDLPLGRLRLKRGGGHGGHNGVRSILQALGTGDFYRLRVGIGRPDPGASMVDWVLSPFAPSESRLRAEVVTRAGEAALGLLRWGFPKAASLFNAVPAATEPNDRSSSSSPASGDGDRPPGRPEDDGGPGPQTRSDERA